MREAPGAEVLVAAAAQRPAEPARPERAGYGKIGGGPRFVTIEQGEGRVW